MHTFLLSLFFTLQALNIGNAYSAFQTSEIPAVPVAQVQTSELRKLPQYIAPVIEATSALAMDRKSGKILYGKDTDKKLSIASITKLMTALVVREKANLDDVVTVSEDAASVDGTRVGLVQGEKITVKDLLLTMLIHSGNDAAYALAEFVGDGNVSSFIDLMNDRAKLEGLTNTHFQNPMGFDNEDNYSTAFDLAVLADRVLSDELLRGIVDMPSADIVAVSGQKHHVDTTNKILGGFLEIKGIKTGTTDQAGTSLVSYATKDNREIIGVLLQSPNRFNEMKVMLDWCYRAWEEKDN